MADIFLSYARADAGLAQRVARELSKRGWSVWFDRELPAHRAYSDVIATELEACSAVLVLWSKESAKSEWVRSEANRARELHKLVQARSEDVRVPMPFDQIQCADLISWRGANSSSGWGQVLRSIGALTEERGGEGLTAPEVGTNRRTVLAATGAVSVLGAGLAGWALWPRQQMSPEAQLYLQKGMDELQANDAFELDNPTSLDQAIALLSKAVNLAPDSATAWGSLAMAFASRKRASPLNERAGLDARSRSAAARALQIDSSEPRALGALRMLQPVYRHWFAAEREDRAALRKQPKMPLLLFLLSDVLASVGRCADAAEISRKFDRTKFLIAGADRKVIISLWSAGDLAAADDAIRQAVERWPHNPYIWRTRIAYLTYTGRTTESLELLRDPDERPSDIDRQLVEAMEATIVALAGSGSSKVAQDKNREFLLGNPTAIFGVAHAFAALKALDDLFQILQGYFFGEGRWKQLAPAGGDENRQTGPLFQPPMRAAWKDARFARLLDQVGLEDYWRQSSTQPDFRRS
ncbi:MAG: toll/interleukin-1 receptor domain-containing protein [Sphingomonas sp.]|nr:toll/interleukin-1 receptor domain-containing protein [Sphingomonas sp.]